MKYKQEKVTLKPTQWKWKNTQPFFFIIIILIVEVRFPKNFNFEIWVSLEWELYYLKK